MSWVQTKNSIVIGTKNQNWDEITYILTNTYVLTNELRNNKLIMCKIANQVVNVLMIEDHTKPYSKYENHNTSKNV